VGGVVNVILRSNYTGATVGGSYGQSSKGDGQTTRAFGTIGIGNVDTDKYNLFLSVEASSQKNIWSTDRGFIGQSDLSQFGYYNTTNGEPRPYFGLGPTANSPFGVVRTLLPDGSFGPRENVISCGGNVSATTGLCLYNPWSNRKFSPPSTG
jgi:iron complex outermembrane receptor protein